MTTSISYRKRVQHSSTESVEDTDHPSICRNKNLFPVVTELESSPVAGAIKPCLERGKRTLFAEGFNTSEKKGNNVLTNFLPCQKHGGHII